MGSQDRTDDKLRIDSPHARPVDEVLHLMKVDPSTGLDSDEVERRRERSGPNTFGATREASAWSILWTQLNSAVVLLLLGAAVAGLLVGEIVEAIAVLVVFLVNAVTGFLTELRAARSMESLGEMVTTITEVERDDRRDEIDASDLVPGDIVGLDAGERVPADLRVIDADDLSIEESALTGESEPVDKQPDAVDEQAPLSERPCMAYMGTTAQSGRGRGVVVATADTTEMGSVARLARSAEKSEAPLQAALERLGRVLSVVVSGIAVALGVIGVLRGLETAAVVEIAIALAVAVVPEGLPVVATLTLAVGMRRMAKRHALVRRLPVVETLGSTTVVCSDKTGTLTENRMEVARVESAGEDAGRAMLEAAVLCNDADIDPDGDPVGDPTEVALLRWAESEGIDWRSLREERPRTDAVPFDSEAKRMATVHDAAVYVKGAPEVLLDPDDNSDLMAAADDMADEALRTLAVARKSSSHGDGDALFEDVEVLGLVGMHDPPRSAAIDAVKACHEAGIRVVMITGDRSETATAVARELGIESEKVMSGSDLREMSEERAQDAVRGVNVFARILPEQKLRIVAALQEAGEIVAVTGDGVNDAPALRQSDVGVAMGRSGTDVARDAADIVLTDDNFASVESAVAEGRRIFTNIRRFGQFLFSWHLAEVLVVTVAIVLGLPAPLAGLMILWNNLIIDVLPSFALALEPGREDVMRRPPRPPAEPVLGKSAIVRILTQGGLVAAVGLTAFLVARRDLELDVGEARTMVFVTITPAQLLGVFNARAEGGSGFAGAASNPWLWIALVLSIVLEAVALTVSPLSDVLGLTPLPARAWWISAALAPIPLALTQGTAIAHARARSQGRRR